MCTNSRLRNVQRVARSSSASPEFNFMRSVQRASFVSFFFFLYRVPFAESELNLYEFIYHGDTVGKKLETRCGGFGSVSVVGRNNIERVFI